MSHLLNINPISEHGECFARSSLTICEDSTIEPLNKFRDAILNEAKYFRLFCVSSEHNIVLPFNRVRHILNSNWLAAFPNMTHALFGYLKLQLRPDSYCNSDFLRFRLIWILYVSVMSPEWSVLEWGTIFCTNASCDQLLIKHLLVKALLFRRYLVNHLCSATISFPLKQWWVYWLGVISHHRLSQKRLLLLLMYIIVGGNIGSTSHLSGLVLLQNQRS